MAKNLPVADVVEEIFQSILATPKRQRRLKSSTFWKRFGFERRTKERVEQVREALQTRAVIMNIDDSNFGAEAKDEWIVLTYVEPELSQVATQAEPAIEDVPRPPDSWFATIEKGIYESEREVEYYFIAPLLEQLGYVEDDFAIGYPVKMYEGVKRVNKEADFVLFDGAGRAKGDALLIVEAKKAGRDLTEDSVGQARAYAMWLTTPYYIVTNGDDIRVYLFRGAVQPDALLMNFKREELRHNWGTLHKNLNKSAAIEYKDRLRRILAAGGM